MTVILAISCILFVLICVFVAPDFRKTKEEGGISPEERAKIAAAQAIRWAEGAAERRLKDPIPEEQSQMPDSNGFFKAWKQFQESPEIQALAFAELEQRHGQQNELQFAINVEVDFAHLFTLKTKEETLAYVKGTDDDGEPVEEVPISESSSSVWFDFASDGPELPYDGEDVPLAQFVSNIAYAIRDDMIPRRNEFRDFRLDRAEDLTLKRIVWMPGLGSWYPQFEIKHRESN